MRKLLLLLITLITLTNVSHAAFPVFVNIQNEVIEFQAVGSQDPLTSIGKISLLLSVMGILLMLLLLFIFF